MKYQIGKKNALSLFLVLSMGMTLLPTTALAEDSIEDNGVEAMAQEQDGADENSAVATFAADENTPTSGSCSDGYYGDLQWNYNKATKTLTISGYGIMSDNYGSIGWTPFCNEIENIVVEEGATWIGRNAFENMPNLTSVQLGKDLKEIHEGAFENDTALESIDIPDSVTYIASDVFKDCGKLKKVGMSASLKYLCNSFSGTAIEVLEVPSTVTEVRTNALENISGLKVIYAGSEAVANLCKEKMPNLTYCITDGGNLKMNQTLTSKGFCEVERSGDILEGWYIGDEKATSLETGKTYTAKWIPDPNVVAEGDCSYKSEDHVTWKYERATKTLTISGKGNMRNYTGRYSVGPYVPWEAFKEEIEKVVVEDGIETIGNGVFSEMPKLKDVDLGKAKEIGTYVFFGDNEEGSIGDISLESIVIPDTVTSIGRCFAGGATNLKNVQMSRNLKYLYARVFSGTSVEVLELPASVERIREWGDFGQHAFDGDYSKLKMIYAGNTDVMELCKVRLYNNVTYAVTNGGYLVKGQKLTSSAFGEVEKDGYIFSGWYDNAACTGEPVTAPTAKGVYYAKWRQEEVQSGKCGDHATWEYHPSNGTLTISGSGEMYDYDDPTGENANVRPWEDISLQVKKVVVEDGITYIGSYAFANMTKELKEVTLGKDITEIGDKAFYCTRAVSNYTLPEGLTKIGELAFSNTDSLDGIKLPSTLTEIGAKAFYAGHLYGIVVPKSVTKIADNTFELIYAYRKSDDAAIPVIYLESDTLALTRNDAAVCRLNGGKMNKTVFEANKFAVPTRAGYIFQGWYEADENGNATETKANVPAANKVYIAEWVESDVTAAAENYSGAYDGENHSITVSYPENAGVTAVLYSTDGETYSSEKSAFTNVTNGEKTVYYRLMRGEVAVAEGSATVEITPCDNPVTMTANPASLKNGGTVTLTIRVDSKAADSNLVIGNITCDKSGIEVAAGEGGTYTVVIPASPSGTYTFTAEVSGDWIANSKNPEVKAVVVNEYGTPSQGNSHSSSHSSNTSTNKTTVSAAENGKITVSKANAAAGEKIVLAPKAEDGYVIDKITVKDKNGNEVALTKQEDGTYTFVMPKGGVDVDATFKKAEEAPIDKPVETKVIKMQIGNKNVIVGENTIANDVAPILKNDRTMVPIRFITESLGGQVAWNEAAKEVTLTIGGKEIKMTIGKTLEKYGVAPVIIDERTFVPVRFVADELGATIAWDDATKTVTITK